MGEPEKLATSSGGALPPDETIAAPDHAAPPSRRLEIAIGAMALAFSLLALWLSRDITLRMGGGGIDPKWWPTVLSVVAAGLSAILVGMSLFAPPMSRGDVEASEKDGWVRMLAALALSALYVVAWSLAGYVIPTLVFTAALLFVFGLRSWKGLVIYSLATTGFIYGLFHYLLRVPL